MRAGWIWIVLLIAAAVVGWMVFGDGGGGEDGDPYKDGPIDGDEEEGGPGLRGTGGASAGTPRMPGALRGGCTLQGTTRRAGEAVPATVELRHVSSPDPKNPFGGGMETQFIARLLDGGMSGKEAIARTSTGGDGTFVFQGLATGLYEVRATTESGAMGFASVSLPAAGARVEVTVEIPDGAHALAGRIEYADGKPFQGSVLASMGNAFAMLMGGGSKSMPSSTDAAGRFRIAGLAPGKYQISALIPGAMRVMGAPVQVPFEGEYVLTINAVGVEVNGTVIDAETEKPIGGAKVFGGGGDPESSFSIFSTASDASGKFKLTLPVGRGGGVFARADGYAAQSADFRPGTAGTESITISLLRLGKLSGRVTAKEGGAPVAGITVFGMSSSARGMMGAPTAAVSDADGRYVLEGVPPGAIRVWALGGGYVSEGMSGSGRGPENTPYTAELEPGQEGTLDLEAVASGRVEGRVTNDRGEAIPGAVVRANGAGNNPMGQMMALFGGLGAAWGAGVTDTDGRYAVDVLVPGRAYTLTVQAPDHPDTTSDEFTAVGGKTQTMDVTMETPRWIEVRVVEADGGAPIPGAALAAAPASGDIGMAMQVFGGGAMWTTDAKGVARIGPLPSGMLKMRVSAPGRIDIEGHDIDEGEQGPITVELTKGLVIAGRIELPEGVPAQGIRVTVQRSRTQGSWVHERLSVKPDGTWRIDTLEEEGTYEVSAKGSWQEADYEAEAKLTTGTEDAVLVLTRSERSTPEMIEITVVDADGKAVPTGRIRLTHVRQNGSSSSSGRINGGTARMRAPDSEGGGEYWVEVHDLIGSRRGATIQGPVSLSGGKFEVRLGPPRSIAGVVTDADGGAVAGVAVSAQPVHPGREGRWGAEHGTASSDAKGRFEIKGLGDHEYKLSFTPPPDYAPTDTQTVQAGATNVRVRVTRGISARLTVLDPDGKPVAGAFAWGHQVNEDGHHVGGSIRWDGGNQTNAQGEVTLRGLVPGALYSLSINVPNGREDLKQISLPKWKPGDETLRFKRAYTIRGIVVDPAGKPLAEMNVQHRKVGTDSWTGWSETDAKGNFTVQQIESGTYELRVSTPGGMIRRVGPGEQAPEPEYVKARAGATGVRLTADPGHDLMVTIRGHASAADEPGGRTASRHAQLVAVGGGAMLTGDWQDSTRVRFRGLRDGARYRLWITGLGDGKYVAEDGIDPTRGTIEVDARDGGVIQGTLKLPSGVAFRQLHVNASNPLGQGVSSQVDPKTGRFRLEGLPRDAEFIVHAHGWAQDGSHYNGQVTAKPGADVAIELAKR